jgi:hypothetical protein
VPVDVISAAPVGLPPGGRAAVRTYSAEALERRRAYTRAWNRAHAGYHRSWARAHRATENARKYRLRAAGMRDNVHQPVAPTPELPPLHVGHPLFDAARELVGERRTSLTTLYDPLYDDLVAVATLALVAGEDARAAVRRYRSHELAWGRITAPILAEFAA